MEQFWWITGHGECVTCGNIVRWRSEVKEQKNSQMILASPKSIRCMSRKKACSGKIDLLHVSLETTGRLPAKKCAVCV